MASAAATDYTVSREFDDPWTAPWATFVLFFGDYFAISDANAFRSLGWHLSEAHGERLGVRRPTRPHPRLDLFQSCYTTGRGLLAGPTPVNVSVLPGATAFRLIRSDLTGDAPAELHALARAISRAVSTEATIDRQIRTASVRVQPPYEDGDSARVVLEVTTDFGDDAADRFRDRMYERIEAAERSLGLRRGAGALVVHWLVGDGT